MSEPPLECDLEIRELKSETEIKGFFDVSNGIEGVSGGEAAIRSSKARWIPLGTSRSQ